MKAVGIVGEAASRLTAETKEAHPGIEWSGIIGTHNHLVHSCFAINHERVLEVVQHDLPKLIPQLELIVPPEPDLLWSWTYRVGSITPLQYQSGRNPCL